MEDFIEQYNKYGFKSNLKINEPMKNHTSFKVGGNADIFINVANKDELIKILELVYASKLPLTIVGNGTNLLVKDSGIRGIVLKYCEDSYQLDGTNINVSAGMLNSKLSYILLENNLSGFEFASGIPGSIGGAIYMNAGAFGSEMKNIVQSVTFLDLNDKKIYTYYNTDCKFDYRESVFQNKNIIILSTILNLHNDEKENIKSKMDEYFEKRKATQPIDKPSAGSTFKRNENFVTAKLIDDAGLKGYKIGGAEVSTKHAGFIVNDGNATADDILNLIDYVKKVIYEKYNVKIENELRIIG